MGLKEFLTQSNKPDEDRQFKISLTGRFEGQEPFLCKTISSIQHRDLVKKATKLKKTDKIAVEVLEISCVEPNFKDVEFIKQCKCASPCECIEKVLTFSEIQALAGAILEESNLVIDTEVIETEAKN